MKISKTQAEILHHLLSFGEIRAKDGGYYTDVGTRVDYRSLNGLYVRGLLRISATNTMPSVGHMASPVFYDTAVTELGLKAFLEFVNNELPYYKQKQWLKDTERAIEEREENESM